MKTAVLAAIFVIFTTVVGGGWFFWNRFINTPASEQKVDITFEVKPGMTLTKVARDLEAQHVVRNANLFLLFARVKGQQNAMKVGEYLFNTTMRPVEVLEILTSGRSIGRNFTVAEGLNLFEIADLYGKGGFGSREEFWDLVNDPDFASSLIGERVNSLEGYLYPETYQITKYTDTKSVIRAMVARFIDIYLREVEPVAAAAKMTRHQIVTLASIIEKETGAPEERPRISSVFHNRLKKGMMLQTDPTVLYGKARATGSFEINITKKDLQAPTEYNTYTIRGLPPGPIANPGRASLLAAVQPEPTEYLFFVSQNDGTHAFTSRYEDHSKAVENFQINKKSREGKSWRDLKKSRAGQNLQQAPNR